MAAAFIIGLVVSVIIGVIGMVIMSEVITAGAFTGLNNTVTTYIPTMVGIGLLALGASITTIAFR